GARHVAFIRRGLAVEVPQFDGRLQGGAQSDVGVAMLRAPDHGFGADYAGYPDRRTGLLVWQRPRIDVTEIEMFAFPAERTGLGPARQHEVVRLVEVFAVIGGIRLVEDLLAARSS